MKPLFTILFTCVISLGLMGQQDIKELKKLRPAKRHHETITALEKKKAKRPEYASRYLSRQASSIRSAALKSGSATNQKMDSLNWELYDAAHSVWMLSDRELFDYDGNGYMITYVWFAFDSVDMEILPFDKEMVKNNAQGKPTEIIWLIWDKESGQWVNFGKYEIIYNEKGNLIRETISDWDPDGNQWLVGAQFDLSYDAEGKLLTEIWSYWDEDSAKIVPSYKDELIYEDGKLTTWNEYGMEKGEWVLIFQTTFTYDTNGNLTDEFTSVWDPNNEIWIDYQQYMYTYNEAGQLIMEEVWEFTWTYFTMLQSMQYEYTWDSDGNMIEVVDRSWELGVAKGTNVWLNESKSEFSFNKNYTILELHVPYRFLQDMDDISFVHMPVSELGYVYVDGDWVFDFRQTAYYSDFGGSTGTVDRHESVISIFPLPASETLTFSWEDSYTSLSLEVYDLSGKRVIERSIDNNETIRVNHLSAGIYLYKLTDNNDLISSGKLSIE